MNTKPGDAEILARMDDLGRAVRGEDPAGGILQLTEEMVVHAPAAPAPPPAAAAGPDAARPAPAPDPLPSSAAAELLLAGMPDAERPPADVESLARAEIRAWLAEHGADILRQAAEGAAAKTGRTPDPD